MLLAVDFPGLDLYLPSRFETAVEIKPDPPVFLISLLSTAGFALIAAAFAYFVIQSRRRARLKLATTDSQATIPLSVQGPGIPDVVASAPNSLDLLPAWVEEQVKTLLPNTISIDVLDLREDLPKVWAIGEPLRIQVSLSDSDGAALDRVVRLAGPELPAELTLTGGREQLGFFYILRRCCSRVRPSDRYVPWCNAMAGSQGQPLGGP